MNYSMILHNNTMLFVKKLKFINFTLAYALHILLFYLGIKGYGGVGIVCMRNGVGVVCILCNVFMRIYVLISDYLAIHYFALIQVGCNGGAVLVKRILCPASWFRLA